MIQYAQLQAKGNIITGLNSTPVQRNSAQYLTDNRSQSAAILRKAVHQHGDSVQRVAITPAPVVQRARRKQAAAALGGGAVLGTIGAVAGSLLLPGLGTYGGAVLGGAIGSVIGGIGGYLASKPKIYTNQQKGDYANELNTLREYQKANRNADNDYQKGTIVKYSRANDRKFVGLLQHGGVLYTYDVNNRLSIGSGQSVMKHALVAKNKDVKAAGWAKPQYTKAHENEKIYQEVLLKLEFFTKEKREKKKPALRIMQKYNMAGFHEIDKIETEHEREIVQDYQTALGQLEYSAAQAEKLERSQRDSTGITKNSRIQLDNDSGHYAPGAGIKAEALEAWRNAGFTNLVWKNWGKTK